MRLRRRVENGIQDEIRFHLEEHAAKLVAEGVSESEAYRQARVAFGGMETSRDGVRSAVGIRPLDEFFADLRYAARILRNSPGFTAIAAGSLALAIGANTTMFSVANFMLLQRLAVPRATELRMLYHQDQEHSVYHMSWGSWFSGENGLSQSDAFTYPVYQQVRRDLRAAGIELFAFKGLRTVNAAYGGSAQAVQAELVSGNLYGQMETKPLLGRGIQPQDDGAPGSGAVAVLSYGFWQSMFGGSPDVLGKVVRVDTFPVTVVGVNAPGFTGAENVQRSPELFLPMSMIGNLRATLGKEVVLQSNNLGWIQLMLRKPAGMPESVLRDRLNQSFHAAVLATVTPKKGETVPTVVLEDGSRGLAQSARFLRKPIYVLLGLVGCVLLLACANVANLMLARSSNRQREISVRLALGAGRDRIFRQLLVESLLLAAIGGAGGALLGYLGRMGAPALLNTAWDNTAVPVPFSWPVFGFTSAITLITGILFGVAPAWQSTGTDVNTALKQGARSASRRRTAWTGKGLVAFQVAMATLLVAGSALFFRTMMNLAAVHPGFEPAGLLLAELQPPDRQYAGAKSIVLHQQFLERLSAIPGVDGATLAVVPLISNSNWNSGMRVEGDTQANASEDFDPGHSSNFNMISPEFFSVMKIPVIAGRGFTPQDTSTSPYVTVVNQAFVKKFFQGQSPIGKRISDGEHEADGKRIRNWFTVVGVCADTQYSDLRTAPSPIYFTDMFQARDFTPNAQGATYILRSQRSPAELVIAMRNAALAIDPDLPLVNIRTQVQQIADVSRQERMFAALTAGFGLLALALACVGIYGVMAYTVSQRTHEIGIRLALGAERARVRGMVLREATWVAGIGVVVGLAAAIALARVVKSLLYNLNPHVLRNLHHRRACDPVQHGVRQRRREQLAILHQEQVFS